MQIRILPVNKTLMVLVNEKELSMFENIMQLRHEFYRHNNFYPSYLICSRDIYYQIKDIMRGCAINLMDEICGMKLVIICDRSEKYMDVAGSREGWKRSNLLIN